MNTLVMKVFQKNYANGAPWKVWCVASVDGKIVVRWSGVGKTLQERTLTGKHILQDVIEEKQKEGYQFLGTFNVTDKIGGEAVNGTQAVDPPAAPSTPKRPDARLYWTASGLTEDWPDIVREVVEKQPWLAVEYNEAGNRKSVILSVQDGGNTAELAIDSNGSGRGVVYEGAGIHLLTLGIMAIAKRLHFTLADRDGNSVALSKIRPGMSHLIFGEISFEDWKKLAVQAGLILGDEQRKMAGSAAFF